MALTLVDVINAGNFTRSTTTDIKGYTHENQHVHELIDDFDKSDGVIKHLMCGTSLNNKLNFNIRDIFDQYDAIQNLEIRIFIHPNSKCQITSPNWVEPFEYDANESVYISRTNFIDMWKVKYYESDTHLIFNPISEICQIFINASAVLLSVENMTKLLFSDLKQSGFKEN